MSDQNAQEPTMEEILASIRRIISEDDAPADAAAPEAEAAAPEPAPAPQPAPPPAPEPTPAPVAAFEEDDVLDLTDPIAPPPAPEPPPPPPLSEIHGDLDIYTPAAAAPPPEPEPAPPPPPVYVAPPEPRPAEVLVGDTAARATASAFSNLAAAIAMPTPGRTLEDVTRELLKPLLAQWLDENLPRIVEAKVEEEIQRVARGR